MLLVFMPLLRSFHELPFNNEHVIQPLVHATMNRLFPEAVEKIRTNAGPRRIWRMDLEDSHPRLIEAPTFQLQSFHAERLNMDWAAGLLPAPLTETQFHQAIEMVWDAAIVNTNDSALKRSKEMLVQCLSETQRQQFTEEYFDVVGSDSRKYRILAKNSYNVVELATGTLFCAVPAQPCPVYDKMMASKLWLETNAEEFRRVANKKSEGSNRLMMRYFDELQNLVEASPWNIIRVNNIAP